MFIDEFISNRKSESEELKDIKRKIDEEYRKMHNSINNSLNEIIRLNGLMEYEESLIEKKACKDYNEIVTDVLAKQIRQNKEP